MEKADCSSVLPSPLSISTKSKMTFLFANLKDREFLVERISDFLQKMPSKPSGSSRAERKASIVDAAPEVSRPPQSSGVGVRGRRRAQVALRCLPGAWVDRAPAWRCWKTSPNPSLGSWPRTRGSGCQTSLYPKTPSSRPACLLLHVRSRLCLDQPPSSLSLTRVSGTGSHAAEACQFGFFTWRLSLQPLLQGHLSLQSPYSTNSINNSLT